MTQALFFVQLVVYVFALRRGSSLHRRVRRLENRLAKAMLSAENALEQREAALDLQLAWQTQLREPATMARLGSWVGFVTAAVSLETHPG